MQAAVLIHGLLQLRACAAAGSFLACDQEALGSLLHIPLHSQSSTPSDALIVMLTSDLAGTSLGP